MARKYRRYYSKSRRDPEFIRDTPQRGLIGKPTWIVFGVFVLAVSLSFIIPAIPQFRKLNEIEMELADARGQERELLKKSEQYKAEANALKKNPGYLEARARDPLRYYRKGESVIQLER